MKRDLDLIRNILLRLEEFPPSIVEDYDYSLKFVEISKSTIDYHLLLLQKSELISGIINRSIINKRISVIYNTLELTPKGYDFLDEIRDQTIWHRIKKELTKANISKTTLSVIIKETLEKII